MGKETARTVVLGQCQKQTKPPKKTPNQIQKIKTQTLFASVTPIAVFCNFSGQFGCCLEGLPLLFVT